MKRDSAWGNNHGWLLDWCFVARQSAITHTLAASGTIPIHRMSALRPFRRCENLATNRHHVPG
jgi:hypothetical protein